MEPSPLDDPLPQEGKQKKSSTIIRPFYVEILFLRRESICDSEAEATSLSKQTDSSKGMEERNNLVDQTEQAGLLYTTRPSPNYFNYLFS